MHVHVGELHARARGNMQFTTCPFRKLPAETPDALVATPTGQGPNPYLCKTQSCQRASLVKLLLHRHSERCE